MLKQRAGHRYAVVSPEMAKAVWDNMINPTAKRIAKTFAQAGIPVGHDTINRWKNDGWRWAKNKDSGRPMSPLEAGRRQLDTALPVLTGDPRTRIEHFMTEAQAELVRIGIEERPDLTNMSANERLNEQARAVSDALIRASWAFQAHVDHLIQTNPEATANLIKAFGSASEGIARTYEQTVILAERAMKVIDQVRTDKAEREAPPIPTDDPLAGELAALDRALGSARKANGNGRA